MIDPHDKGTIDAFGEEHLVRRGKGRPISTTEEERRERNRLRQTRFRENKKLKEQAASFLSDLLTKATKGANRSNRQTLIEALQFMAGNGENLDCEVEFEDATTKAVKFDALPEIIGAAKDDIYIIR